MSTARFSALASLVAGVVLSALAGFAAFGLDLGLARLTLGHALPLEWIHVAVYLAAGVAMGTLAILGAVVLRRSVDPPTTGALAFAGVYALPVAERLHHVVRPRVPDFVEVVAIVVALAGYGAVGWGLRRLAGGEGGGDGPGAWRVASIVLGVLTALGLAVNRDLVERPFEPAALVADAVLVAAAALAAWSFAGRSRGRLALGVAGLLVAGLFVAGLFVVLLRPSTEEPLEAADASVDEAAPNLLLVVIDTLRGDTFDAVLDVAPEGRALAERLGGAAYFSRAIAAAPWTAPSIGSILTGLYPQEHGFGHHVGDPSRPLRALSPTVPTLAGRLANRGYRTEAVVTNPLLHGDSGIDRGFGHFELLGGTTTKMPLLGVVSANGLRWLDGEPYQPAPWARRRAEARLEHLAGRQPFFLYLHFMDPHEPLHAHPELPPLDAPLRVGSSAAGTERRAAESLYVDETRLVLREIDRLIAWLESRGLWEDTAFVLVADHGEMFVGDDRRTGVEDPRTKREKNTGHGHALFDELVRVPLVIRPPGGLDGPRRVDALVSHVDLHDTIVDLLGVDVPPIGRDRISVARRLEDGARPNVEPSDVDSPSERPWALLGGMEWGSRQRGLRTRGEKIIVYEGHRRDADRFDLLADPAERDDLARGERKRLLERLDAAWAGLDEGPTTEAVEVDAETRRRLEALGYVQ